MIQPQQQFFLSDSKIHTVASSACVLPPPSDHIYEVFRVISGVPLFLEDHISRLEASMEAAGIIKDPDSLNTDIRQLLSLNQYAAGNIKIIFWKSGDIVHNMLFYDKHQYPTEEMFLIGIIIGSFQHERKNPNVKLFDSGMRQNAAKLIEDHDFYEVLLISEDQRITEGSRSNIFFIDGNRIITPPADQVLEGITRKQVISLIQKLGIDFSEEPVFAQQLETFSSVFITGTSRRVLPVIRIEPYPFRFDPGHSLIRILQHAFTELCAQYIALKKSSQ